MLSIYSVQCWFFIDVARALGMRYENMNFEILIFTFLFLFLFTCRNKCEANRLRLDQVNEIQILELQHSLQNLDRRYWQIHSTVSILKRRIIRLAVRI